MRPTTRTLGIVLVALLVALAGCSDGPGNSGDGDHTSDQPATDAPTTTGTGPASGGTETSTSGGEDGVSTGGQGPVMGAFTQNKAQIVQSHGATLTAAGSYTAVVNATWSGTDGTAGSQSDSLVATTTTYADPATGEYYQVTIIPVEQFDYRIERYSPAGENVTYTRTNVYGQASYTKRNETLDTTQLLRPASNTFFDSLDFQPQGTVTRDGETLQRYTVTDLQHVENTTYFQGALASIDVEVLYNPALDLMQDVRWTYSYEDDSGGSFSSKFHVSYSDIGSTTVSAPDWLDTAKQQATSVGSYGGYDFNGTDYSSVNAPATP